MELLVLILKNSYTLSKGSFSYISGNKKTPHISGNGTF